MQLLGVRIDNVTMSEVLQKIEEFLSDGRQHYIVTINPEFIVRAQKDKEFCKILNEADLAIPDGIGILWAAKVMGEKIKERVTGTDLIEKIKITNQNAKIFLIGGKNGVAEKVSSNWSQVVGFCEEANSIEPFVRIRQYQPEILLVALGAPKQEKWIAQNLSKVPSVKVAIGVGGAFDLISGRIRRAPVIMQKIGLEWLWRLALEPSRLPRIFRAVVVFPFLVLKSKINTDKTDIDTEKTEKIS